MALYNFIYLTMCIAAVTSVQQFETELNEYRLPQDSVSDLKYILHLTLAEDVFQTNKFSGHLQLEFKSLKSTDELKLHASGINFTFVEFGKIGITGENITSYSSNATTEVITFSSLNLVANEIYALNFDFDAELRTESLYGLYKSSYKTRDGDERFLATTQFQATYARRVFPCFDEPSFKGTFDISITHPANYTAYANTKVKVAADTNQGYKITTFEITPIMPTYLVAFIISDFDCTRGENIDAGTEYSVCSRPESAVIRKVAVEVGPKLLRNLEEFTGIPYNRSGITKMDQFAIPDFSAGAMENWGIVTYRETGLLWDPEESTNDNKQRIEAVIAHEFAHMWFGNLITTHWWSDTFLNEGFARYFQYFTTAAIEPEWDLDKQFVVEQLQGIFNGDALNTSQALSYPASTPSEISSRFASVSYNKGASVLRMLEHFIGSDSYKAGLQKYLSNHQFNNTKPEDLWTDMADSSKDKLPQGLTLDAVMKNWIENPGYPVLNVTLHERHAMISQQRFLTSGTPNGNENWYVPVSYTTSDEHNKFQNTSTKFWLTPDEKMYTITLPENAQWIILNNQQIGYYRVNYAEELWNNISIALNKPGFDGISVINRAQIVDDIYNLAKVGFQPYSRVFNLFSFLRSETSYFPWYSAFVAFSNMLSITGDNTLRQALSNYIVNLMQNLYNSAPFAEPNNDQHIYTLKRVLAVNWACRLGVSDCINSAQVAFNNFRTTEIKPDKNLRSVIYCSALRNSMDNADWNFLWGKYLASTLAAEKSTILTSLGCSTDKAILVEFLKKSIDKNSGIRQQDALSVFSAVYSGNPEGVDIAFDFLLENHAAISAYYGSLNSLNSLITGLTSRFTKKEQTDKLNNFIENTENLDESLVSSARAQLANAITNLERTAVFERDLRTYFFTRTSSSVTVKLSPVMFLLMLFLKFVH